jgi:hypothetical protein
MSTTENYDNQVLLADDTVTASTLAAGPTRTVAIIKHHALQHRFDIETRIAEAGFEVGVSLKWNLPYLHTRVLPK